MNKYLAASLLLAGFFMASCSEEPLNAECDIEVASVHVDDPESIFYHAFDTLQTVSSVSDSIGFFVRPGVQIASLPLTLTVTPGATIFMNDGGSLVPFVNGSLVDFSGDQMHNFRIVSEDKAWSRDYKIGVVHDVDPSFGHKFYTFTFDGNYALNDPSKTVNDRGCYFVWTETDSLNVADIFGVEPWKCGNPGFKLSKSSAKPMEYPSIPLIGGGPDGSDCVKLETMGTGSFGVMVDMRMAAGSLFTGEFDVANALKDALKATRFGVPFKHKPIKFAVDLRFELGEFFQDKKGNKVEDVIDEPDAYVVVYRNQDEQGNEVMLDGNDVLINKYIVGMARLPHNYYYEEVDGRTIRRDLVGNNPIHGVTSEWQHFEMDIEYTQEIDPEVLANNGYNLIISFSSSWQGAYFRGAIGNKLFIDNITLECEY